MRIVIVGVCLAPCLDYTLVSEAPAPKPTNGTFTQFGIANPLLKIVDLSWTLGHGFTAQREAWAEALVLVSAPRALHTDREAA